MALKDITRDCENRLGPLSSSLLVTIGQILPNVPPGGGESMRLMYAAAKLLKSLPSQDEQIKHLEATMGTRLVKVQELLQLPIKDVQLSVTNELKMVTTFISTLEGPISDAVLDAIMPIFEGVRIFIYLLLKYEQKNK